MAILTMSCVSTVLLMTRFVILWNPHLLILSYPIPPLLSLYMELANYLLTTGSQLILSEDSRDNYNVSYLIETEILPGTGPIAETCTEKAQVLGVAEIQPVHFTVQ